MPLNWIRNRLGTKEESDKRDFIVREFITSHKIDYFCKAEVNIYWKIVSKKKSLHQLAKKWFRHSRVTTSHNNKLVNTKFPHQQGGVGITMAGDLALHASQV